MLHITWLGIGEIDVIFAALVLYYVVFELRKTSPWRKPEIVAVVGIVIAFATFTALAKRGMDALQPAAPTRTTEPKSSGSCLT